MAILFITSLVACNDSSGNTDNNTGGNDGSGNTTDAGESGNNTNTPPSDNTAASPDTSPSDEPDPNDAAPGAGGGNESTSPDTGPSTPSTSSPTPPIDTPTPPSPPETPTPPSPPETPTPGNGGDSGENGENGSNAGENGGGTGLSGAPADILSSLVDSLNAAGLQMPMSFPPTPVSAQDSQNAIGLSEADFNNYVSAAAQSIAAIGTFAHQIVIIQGVDDNAAAQIKKLVSGSGGYDSQKWICVFPEKTVAIDAGPYVLLVAANRDVVDAAVELFKTAAGNAGEAVTFYEGI
ncbi:MAG: hypothetical protein FWH33_01925 [Oscillospiraceae bacterium]|nr:hypothetical protein [Oscillospiraceae bacterium]